MPPTVRDAGPFEKFVTFDVSEAELETAKTKAARRLSREINIRGFRPGKAPRPIVEATVGSDRLRSEAIDELIPDKLGSVLAETDLRPAVTPRLESLDDTEQGIEVEVRVTLWPKLSDVPEHQGRRIEVGSPAVTDEELDEQIQRLRDQFAELETVDRPAQEGDFVSLDLSATADGAPVEEATASQLLYEVGSGGFLEGIDEVLLGAAAGDERTFAGQLPQGFGDQAGMDVEFTVSVTEVRRKVLPELTDEWVDEVTEFEAVEDLRTSLRDQMTMMKRRSLAAAFREKALQGLVDQVEVQLPEALVEAEMDELLHRFLHRLEDQEVSLDDYFSVTGLSREQFAEDLRAQSERSIKTRLLLEAVADQDGLEVFNEELTAMVELLAQSSDQPDQLRRALLEGPGGQSLAGDILRNKALDAIVSGAIPVDEDGNEVDLTFDEPSVVEGEVVEGEVVAGDEMATGEVAVTAEVVEAEVVESGADTGAPEEE